MRNTKTYQVKSSQTHHASAAPRCEKLGFFFGSQDAPKSEKSASGHNQYRTGLNCQRKDNPGKVPDRKPFSNEYGAPVPPECCLGLPWMFTTSFGLRFGMPIHVHQELIENIGRWCFPLEQKGRPESSEVVQLPPRRLSTVVPEVSW